MAASLDTRLEETNAPVARRLAELFIEGREPRYVYGLLSEFLLVPGKRLRPALCLLSCEAAGGKRADALHAATAIEMFHNFTLIHDDIEDASTMRRGSPCMHIKYGLPLALNAGDGLFMMVWREALNINGPKSTEAQKCLLTSFTKVLEGQAWELGWYHEAKWDVSEEEYLAMVGGKTGALIAGACEVGAILGGADGKTTRALSKFGMGIGIAFQIIDDMLNIVGEEKKYMKEIGGDIREGKRTLMTIWALQSLPPAKKKELETILRKKSKTGSEVKKAILLLKESGAPKKAAAVAEQMIDEAFSQLDSLPQSEAKQAISGIARYITKRER
ncbi:Short chain isoprenyl diphosphate synthase [uncultured archaeon]|nr:Short chain isoprenyl diphosphate synthase [uncultured archaeon]